MRPPKTRLCLDPEIRPKHRWRLRDACDRYYGDLEVCSREYWGRLEHWKAKNHTEQVCGRRQRRSHA